MEKDLQQLYETWDAFLREWPLERLRRMTLPEYTAAGQSHTFTAWIESRLDKLGSIWGGSSFKFGIYSRRDKTEKAGSSSDAYTQDYAWYRKYGSTPEEAFERVKALVVQVAEAAARGDFTTIDAVDLGEAYKWKIAFHYQDRDQPGVIAVFKAKRLQAWLRGRVGTLPQRASELHRLILSLRDGRDLMDLSREVWEETEKVDPPVKETDPPPGPEEEALPLNLILYGPPGTGKTYQTAELAVKICDGVLPESREALMTRYRELRNLRRIRFVTFHPSFSYEEFVEGIRPVTAGGQVHYEVRPGVFKQAVAYARELLEKREAPAAPINLQGRKLYKMSLGDSTRSDEAWIYPDCLENGYVCLGFGDGIDFTGCDTLAAVRERFREQKPGGNDAYAGQAVNYLKNEIHKGDLILVSHGNTRFRAIAEVTGPYTFEPREAGYDQRRPVRWLWSTATDSLPVDMVFSKRLSQMTLYLMDQEAVLWPALRELLFPRSVPNQAPNCVLVIDEINRANLAKTFGELITLLEPSKRLGGPDEQETELPYSGDRLSIPPNLYVIGTMNTADRSIALMDTALRRRFAFREMMPRPDLLHPDIAGIDLRALLTAMNERIERIFDRDHVLGHTYLLGIASFEELEERFRTQIIPLLQEYFFEDWRRIQDVFNDRDQPRELQIVQEVEAAADGWSGREQRRRYQINPVLSPGAIQKICP